MLMDFKYFLLMLIKFELTLSHFN
jgi:hypothetical protein